MSPKTYRHFTREERYVLSAYLKDGLSLRKIANKLGRSVGAISHELRLNTSDKTRLNYDPGQADFRARLRKWEANSRNPLKDPRVRQYTIAKLQLDWSPEQIAGRIVYDFPGDAEMRISHETIYRFINAPEGRALNLIRHLRRGKPRRSKRRYRPNFSPIKQPIANITSITERPAIVSSKLRYGDWEGDSMKGGRGQGAALSVQGERRSRFVVLTKVPNLSASETQRAAIKKLAHFPPSLRRTLTLDRGTENARHERIAKTLEMKIYFCDPYSSWQKGFVENAIGLIRQYLPKRTDLASLSPQHLRVIQNRLNHRPRKSLHWRTPAEVLSSHLNRLGVQLPT